MITVYTKTGCLPCTRVKKWLKDNNLDYEDKDGPNHLEEIVKMGWGRAMPIVLKDGELVSVGVFDEEVLKKVLL